MANAVEKVNKLIFL